MEFKMAAVSVKLLSACFTHQILSWCKMWKLDKRVEKPKAGTRCHQSCRITFWAVFSYLYLMGLATLFTLVKLCICHDLNSVSLLVIMSYGSVFRLLHLIIISLLLPFLLFLPFVFCIFLFLLGCQIITNIWRVIFK